jgi:hypothetical protein
VDQLAYSHSDSRAVYPETRTEVTETEDDGLKEEDERHSLVGSAAHEREVDAAAVLIRLLLAHLACALCQSSRRVERRERRTSLSLFSLTSLQPKSLFAARETPRWLGTYLQSSFKQHGQSRALPPAFVALHRPSEKLSPRKGQTPRRRSARFGVARSLLRCTMTLQRSLQAEPVAAAERALRRRAALTTLTRQETRENDSKAFGKFAARQTPSAPQSSLTRAVPRDFDADCRPDAGEKCGKGAYVGQGRRKGKGRGTARRNELVGA